jgi:S1-C subfamily serine protease
VLTNLIYLHSPMKNTNIILILLLAVLTQSSCTLMFSSQRIRFVQPDKESSYYINNDELAPKTAPKLKKKVPFVVIRMKEGYRTKSEVHIAKRLDPLVALTVGIFFSAPYLIALDGVLPGGPFKHPPKITLDHSEMSAIPSCPLPDIYLEASNHLDSISLSEAHYYNFKKIQQFNEREFISGHVSQTAHQKKLFSKNVYNLDALVNDQLEVCKAQPDLAYLIKPYDRNFNLDIRFEDMDIAQVKHGNLERGFATMVFLFRDRYEQVKDSLIYRVSSVWYKTSSSNPRFMIQTMMEDGFSQLFDDELFIEKLKQVRDKTEENVAAYPLLQLSSDKKGSNLESAVNAQITLKNETYLSSGFMISNEGHFITSYSTVTDLDSLVVIFSDGSSKKPRLERMDPVTNVALMKIDTTGITTLAPSMKGTPLLGSTLYAVGTPVNEWLDHSLTKGIVSGVRSIDGFDMVQTDTRSSYGNNGSPVLDASGQVVGIMNNKLFFLSAQGLSMVVPIATVLERLHLQIN